MVGVASSGLVALLFLVGGTAQAAIPPTVVDQSVSQLTPTGATLEASLESGSAEAGAYYQFQFSEFPTEFPDELSCPPPPSSGAFLPCSGPESSDALPIGHIPQNEGETTVALDLADAGLTLEPGTTYYFRVVAASAVQSEDTIEWEDPVVGGGEQAFTTGGLSSPPLVTGEAAAQVGPTTATLEALLDAEAGAYYQFQFSEFPTEFPDELSCPPPPVLGLPACVGPQSGAALPIGYVQGDDGRVALSLSEVGITLKPGATYFFRVLVATAKQTEDSVEWEKPVTAGEVQAFTTPAQASEPAQQSTGGAGNPIAGPAPTAHRRHHRRHRRHRHARHRHGAGAIALARRAR
jgi:hypothetical protein